MSPPSPNPDSTLLPPTTTQEEDLPGFAPPLRQPSQDPLDPTTTTQEPAPGEPSPDDDELGSATRSRTRGSTRPFPASTSAFRPVVDTAIRLLSLLVHFWRAPGDNDLWLADDEDVSAIGEPLARIAARHVPIADTEETNDVLDGITAGVGVIGYAAKNTQRQAQARAGGAPTPGWDQQAEQDAT